MRKKLRKLFNCCKHTKVWDDYRVALTSYNKELRKSKRESWRKHCESIVEAPVGARLQKALCREHTNGVTTLRRPDGSYTINRKDTLEYLLQVHFPGSSEASETDELAQYDKRSVLNKTAWSLSGVIFAPDKVNWAIRSFQPFKAPGEDHIFPALLIRGLDILLKPLVVIFRHSFSWECIPLVWRKVNVVFIPKMGRRSKELPKSYRPISLTSFLLKTMERLVDLHIREKLETTIPLQQSQFAYNKGKSTEGALHYVVTKIERALSSREIALCAFLDIEGAFDNTDYRSIERALLNKKIDTPTVGWVKTMLGSRIISSTLGAETVSVKAMKGCPQGGVLSPLLWSLVIDDLLIKLKETGFDAIGYADDLTVIVSGKFGATISNIMNQALVLISDWCRAEGLSINPSKTIIVPFTKKLKLNLDTIIVEGTTISYSNEVKYLGVILDKRLNWNSHLEAVIEKASRAMWACRSLYGRTWGLDSNMIHWMYTMMIRPIITYASLVWWPKANQVTTKQLLSSFQRQACLAITGAMNSCPNVAIEAIIGLSPLHIFLKKCAARSALKMQILLGKNLPDFGHTSIITEIPDQNIVCSLTDYMIPKYVFNRRFEIIISDRDEWELGGPWVDPRCLEWFTDGSKTNTGVGAGIYGPNTKISEPMGKWPSVFQAEIQAISICARINLMRGNKGAHIAIYSDSQAALKALAAHSVESKLVYECLNNLNQLSTKNKIVICWVPGHSGIKGNEIADELARVGSATNLHGPEPYCGINWAEARCRVNSWENAQRITHWEVTQKLRQAKRLIRPFTYNRELHNMRKVNIRKIVGFLTGHYYLNYHLSKILIGNDAECRLCLEDDETTEHILCNCNALAKTRLHIFYRDQVDPNEIKNAPVADTLKFIRKAEELLKEFGFQPIPGLRQGTSS